jgi:hypothetical protein
MKHARIFFFTLLGLAAACSGYDGGGDVLVTGGVFDGGSGADGAGPTPTVDSGEPRFDGSTTDARVDGPSTASSSIIAYWPFNGDGVDHGPASKHLDLTISSGNFEAGRVGSSLALVGAAGRATRPTTDSELGFGSGDFTIQAWMSISSALLGFGTRSTSTATDGWAVLLSPNNLFFYAGTSNDPLTASVSPVSNFRHVVVVRKSGVLALLVDGATVATRNDSTVIGSTQPFYISRTDGTISQTAHIDDVVIWSRALSGSEINNNFIRGNSGMPPLLTE